MKRTVITLLSIIFVCIGQVQAGSETDPYVNSYYGEYDAKLKDIGFPSKSLKGPVNEKWSAPERTEKGYRIGVLFPHLKDSYWIAVNYGIISEAKKLNVGIKVLSAGGYEEAGMQKKQFMELIKEKTDGIILGSVSYKSLDSLVKMSLEKGIPVIEVINDIYAPAIKAKALVSFYDMGSKAAGFVVKDSKEKDIRVAFFPGPKDSGWAPDSFNGFFETVKKSKKIRVFPPQWGDTGHDAQRKLILKALKEYPDLDYLVGNAVAAEVAVDVLKKMGRGNAIKIVSTYIVPAIYDKVKEGLIAASPSDLTVVQGKMAVDMMVRLLNGETPGKDFPFRSGPMIPVITAANISQYSYEFLFGSRDFKPVLEMDADM